MATKTWANMTDEEKKARMALNKEYAYKRKAKALGISVEEYKERLGQKKKGKTAKEAGLRTGMRVTKVDKVTHNQMMSLIGEAKGSYVPTTDGSAHMIMRADDDIRVMARKGDMAVVRYLRHKPSGSEDDQPTFFVNLMTKKQYPFVKEKDYLPEGDTKNADAIAWANAEKLLV